LLRAPDENTFVTELLGSLGSYPPYFRRLGENWSASIRASRKSRTLTAVGAANRAGGPGRLGLVAELLIAVNPDEDSRLPFPYGTPSTSNACTWPSQSFEPATGKAPVKIAAKLAADLCERHVAAASGGGIDSAAAGKDSRPDSRMT
jgi:hypothetical protein